MKKTLASVAVATLLAPLANADQAVVTALEEPTVVEQPECCEPDFGGFGFILGIGGSFAKNELKIKDTKVADKNANRFIGTVGIQGGKVFRSNYYVGAEFLFDFTKNKKNYFETLKVNDVDEMRNASMQMNGCMYSLGLRLGYIFPKYNTMVYFKVAGSHATTKISGDSRNDNGVYGYEEGKVCKIAPSIALGVEKAFCKKFTARLEGEYRFQAKKGEASETQLKQKGMFNIRALLSYNVRF